MLNLWSHNTAQSRVCAHTSPQPFNTQEEVHVACLVSGVFHLELARLITKVGERQGSEQRLGSDPYRYVLGTSLSSSSAVVWGTILSRGLSSPNPFLGDNGRATEGFAESSCTLKGSISLPCLVPSSWKGQ